MQRGAAAGIIQSLQHTPGGGVNHEQVVNVFDESCFSVGRKRQVHRPATEVNLLTSRAQDLLGRYGLFAKGQLAHPNIRMKLPDPIKTFRAGYGNAQTAIAESADIQPNAV